MATANLHHQQQAGHSSNECADPFTMTRNLALKLSFTVQSMVTGFWTNYDSPKNIMPRQK